MTTKELIREKIDAFYAEYKAKFHQNGDSYHLGIIDGLDIAERILDTLPDEPVTDCHELEEEISRTYHDGSVTDTSDIDHVAYENIASHFAEWQKAKMMKKAFVDNYVVDDGRIELEGMPLPCLNPIILLTYPQFQPGDKVKIIVVKEEE